MWDFASLSRWKERPIPLPSLLNHYFTLCALRDELNRSCIGRRIEELYSQQKNILTIALEARGEATPSIVASIDPASSFLYFDERSARAKRNSVDLFPDIAGATIERCEILPFDRVMIMTLGGGQALVFQLFQTAAANILLLDSAGTICESFKRDDALRGTRFAPQERAAAAHLLENPEAFLQELGTAADRSVVASLRATLPSLGRTYAEEICARVRVHPDSPLSVCTPAMRTAIAEEVRTLYRAADSPRPTLHRRDGDLVLAICELTSLSGWEVKRFRSMSDAVRAAAGSLHHARERDAAVATIEEPLTKELQKTSRARAAAERETGNPSRAEEYELFANLILAHLPSMAKGARSAELENIFGDGTRVVVPLEARLNPAMNADRYFQKAKDARAAAEEARRRSRELREREELVTRLLSDLSAAESSGSIDAFTKTHHDALNDLGLLPAVEGREPIPFRVFAVAGGLEVWVGKSSANNDLLTTRYAKPYDLWFHVRGASGSHTVLKTGKSEPPPREAVRQAAAIAAYYSKMRNARSVPVAYCERKYVRKPKGAAQGAVVLEREEIIFVTPSLP